MWEAGEDAVWPDREGRWAPWGMMGPFLGIPCSPLGVPCSTGKLVVDALITNRAVGKRRDWGDLAQPRGQGEMKLQLSADPEPGLATPGGQRGQAEQMGSGALGWGLRKVGGGRGGEAAEQNYGLELGFTGHPGDSRGVVWALTCSGGVWGVGASGPRSAWAAGQPQQPPPSPR